MSTDATITGGMTSGVTAVSLRASTMCAVANGAAKCLGVNTRGQLGNGIVSAASYLPVQPTGMGSGVSLVAAGSDFYHLGVTAAASVGAATKPSASSSPTGRSRKRRRDLPATPSSSPTPPGRKAFAPSRIFREKASA